MHLTSGQCDGCCDNATWGQRNADASPHYAGGGMEAKVDDLGGKVDSANKNAALHAVPIR